MAVPNWMLGFVSWTSILVLLPDSWSRLSLLLCVSVRFFMVTSLNSGQSPSPLLPYFNIMGYPPNLYHSHGEGLGGLIHTMYLGCYTKSWLSLEYDLWQVDSMINLHVPEWSHVGFYCLIMSCCKYMKTTYTHNLDERFMPFILICLSNQGDPQLEFHGVLCLLYMGHTHLWIQTWDHC